MNNKLLFHFTASGCYTALCLATLSLSTDIIVLKKTPDWQYFLFLFFTSFLYYNFHKISWFGHPRMLSKVNLKYAWPSQYPGLLLLCLIVGFIGSVAFVTQSINNPYKVILGFTAGFIAINYNIQIFGFRLRSVKGLKSFTIAAVSVITAIFIPVATKNNLNLFIGLDFILFALAQFFFITSLCIAADIRDMAEDKEDAIKTFPVAAGIELSKKFILILLLLNIVLLIILNQRLFLNMQQLECLLLVSMLAMIISFQINPKNSFYYFILIIDGVIALQAFSILITNY